MDDLIKRKDAERELTALGAQLSEKNTRTVAKCICEIKDVPAVDAVPVVHGRWVKANGMMPPEYHGRKCCSVCDAFASTRSASIAAWIGTDSS